MMTESARVRQASEPNFVTTLYELLSCSGQLVLFTRNARHLFGVNYKLGHSAVHAKSRLGPEVCVAQQAGFSLRL